MYTRNNIKKMSNLPVDLWKIEDLYLSFLNILLFYVHANTSSPSTYKRNNMKKISNLPVDRWKIADMYTRNNIKKISYLPVVLWKIEDLFLSFLNILQFYVHPTRHDLLRTKGTISKRYRIFPWIFGRSQIFFFH